MKTEINLNRPQKTQLKVNLIKKIKFIILKSLLEL
jgi:hypothetical protein